MEMNDYTDERKIGDVNFDPESRNVRLRFNSFKTENTDQKNTKKSPNQIYQDDFVSSKGNATSTTDKNRSQKFGNSTGGKL